MRPNQRVLLVAMAACGLGLFSCGDSLIPGGDQPPSSRRGALAISLTDAPLEAREVWVTINEIEVHPTGSGWQSFVTEEMEFELLALEGRESLLAAAELEDGKYTKIRLRVQEGYLIDNEGERCDLKVPSGKIDVPVPFEIDAGATTSMLLDFDAEKSVHVTRKGKKMECQLRPVIKLVDLD